MWIPWPIALALATAAFIFMSLFTIQYLIERRLENRGFYITLTPFQQIRESATKVQFTNVPVDFNPRIESYLKVAEVMVTLASASLVFIPTVHIDKGHPMFAYGMVLVGCTVVFGALFMALLTYFYEMFLFDQTRFGAGRSSLIFSTGFSGMICFAIAYVVLAVQIAIAYTNGEFVK